MRTQELAEVGRRLEDARQQEAKAREELTRLSGELTNKASELARAEQQMQ